MTDHWKTRKMLSNDGQCKPFDIGCHVKRIIESMWGLVESEDYECDFTGLHTNQKGEKYLRGTCKKTDEVIMTKQCFELSYPFVKSTCKYECTKKGMDLDKPACNGDNVLCICKPNKI